MSGFDSLDKRQNSIVIDLDGTLTLESEKSYEDKDPNLGVINTLKKYRNSGFHIVVCTARNMRTFDGNIYKIKRETLPIIERWLKKHDVPFDEIIIGKPWCGEKGFYVDDKAIRPDEFTRLTSYQIERIVNRT